MAWWGAVAQFGMEIGKEWMNSSQQHKANRTNIMLQREQQDWSKEMSNTAVQRRAADIEAAGGNRALAFTNGQEASSPVMSPATVNPPQIGAVPNITSKQMQLASIDNIKADTLEKLSTAKSKAVQARIDEATELGATDLAAKKNVERYDQEALKTKIMRSVASSSATEAKRNAASVDAIVQQAVQAAEKGDLEVKQLRNIVNAGGLSPEDEDSVLRYLIDVLVRGK